MDKNIVKITIDTVEGPEEAEIDLDSLSLEELRDLGQYVQAAQDLYFDKLTSSPK